MNKNKSVVIIVKGGLVQEVYSNDQNVSVSVIDIDVKKECEGFTSSDIDKVIASETKGLSKVLAEVE